MFVIAAFLSFFLVANHFIVIGEIVLGCNSLLDVGSNVFVLIPVSRCAGDPRLSDRGMFLYSRRLTMGLVCLNLTFSFKEILNGLYSHPVGLGVKRT